MRLLGWVRLQLFFTIFDIGPTIGLRTMATSRRDGVLDTHSLVLFWWQVQRLEQWTPHSSSWEQILSSHFSPFQPSVQIHSPVRKSHSPPFWATVQLKVNRSFCTIEEVLSRAIWIQIDDFCDGRGYSIILFVPKLTEPFPGSRKSDDSPPRSIPPDTPPHTAMTMWSFWLVVNGARMQKKTHLDVGEYRGTTYRKLCPSYQT